MAITTGEVKHIALLAKLDLHADEVDMFAQQLNVILDYADTLNKVPTDDVEPLIHILPAHNVFREDEVKPSMLCDEILANAPLTEAGQYKVPKIM